MGLAGPNQARIVNAQGSPNRVCRPDRVKMIASTMSRMLALPVSFEKGGA